MSQGHLGECGRDVTTRLAGGASRIRRGVAIAALEATRSRHFMPYLLGLLAHVRFRLGQPMEAMKAVEEKKLPEEKVIAQEEDPPDAKYTITGRRIY